MENYNAEMEKNLIEMVRQKEQSDKRLLKTEIIIGVVSTAFFFAMFAVSLVFKDMEKPSWMIYLPAGLGFLQFIICMMLALRIEQVAGYYECRKCGHRYVPTYKAVNLAMHMGRTRYMKCPKCGKMSWQRKVISDGEQEK